MVLAYQSGCPCGLYSELPVHILMIVASLSAFVQLSSYACYVTVVHWEARSEMLLLYRETALCRRTAFAGCEGEQKMRQSLQLVARRDTLICFLQQKHMLCR